MIKSLLTSAVLAAMCASPLLAATNDPAAGQDPLYTAIYIAPTINGQSVPQGTDIEFVAYMDGNSYSTSEITYSADGMAMVVLQVPGDEDDLGKFIDLHVVYSNVEYVWNGEIKWEGETGQPRRIPMNIQTLDQYEKITLQKESYYLNAGTNETVDLADAVLLNGQMGLSRLNPTPVVSVEKQGTSTDITIDGSVVKAVNSTSPDGVEVKVSVGGLSTTTMIYPYFNVSAITMSDVYVEVGETVNLLDNVTFTLSGSGVTKKANEFCAPKVEFDLGNYVDYAKIEGSMLTAEKATSPEGVYVGVEVKEHIQFDAPSNQNGLLTGAPLYITPFHYPITNVKLEDVTVEKGQTVDLLNYVSFLVNSGANDNGVWMALSDMNYKPTLRFNVENAEIAEINGTELTALKSTDFQGIKLEVYATHEDIVAANSPLHAEAKLYVTPFLQIIDKVGFKKDLYSLNLSDNASVNLLNELVFTVYTTPEDVKEVSYAELENKPTLRWGTTDDAVEISQAGVASAKAKTGIEGAKIAVTVANTQLGATTQVRVSPYIFQFNEFAVRWTQETLDLTVGDEKDLMDYLEFCVITGTVYDEAGQFVEYKTEWLKADQLGNDLSDLDIYTQYGDALSIEGTILTALDAVEGAEVVVFLNNDAILKVNVKAQVIPVESISLTVDQIRMGKDDYMELSFTVLPENADFDPELLSFYAIPEEGNYMEMWGEQLTVSLQNGRVGAYARYAGEGTLYVSYNEEPMTEVPVCIGSKYEIPAGWSWISLYNVDADQATIEGADENIFGGNLLELRSQTKSTMVDSEFGYFGNLLTVGNGAYHALTAEENSALVFGNRNFESQSLYAGYTWVYYPYQISATLGALAETFDVLSEGDMLITKTGFAVKTNGDWSNDLTIEAGESFIVKAETAATLTWYEEWNLPYESGYNAASRRNASVWQYDATKFANNMCVIGRIDSNSTDLQVGAFVGDECRGEGRMVEIDGERYFFITVQGKAGEKVSFRAYDGMNYENLQTEVKFTNVMGTLSEPVYLGAASVSGIESITVGNSQSSAYDLMGRQTTAERGLLIKGSKAQLLK